MKDKEIIKALECCCTDECEECPYYEQTACIEYAKQGAIDLINHLERESNKYRYKAQTQKGELARLNEQVAEQKAEIERLKADKEALINGQITLQKNLPKVFAERLKKKIDDSIYKYWNTNDGGYYLAEDVEGDIDAVLEELSSDIPKIEHTSLCETDTYKVGDVE